MKAHELCHHLLLPCSSPLPTATKLPVLTSDCRPLLQRTIKACPRGEKGTVFARMIYYFSSLLPVPSSLTGTVSSYAITTITAITATCLTWAFSSQHDGKHAPHTQTRLPTHFWDSLIPLIYFLPPGSGGQIQGCALEALSCGCTVWSQGKVLSLSPSFHPLRQKASIPYVTDEETMALEAAVRE